MKTYALIAVHLIIAFLLLEMSCTNTQKNKLQGYWISKDGNTKLKITDRGFAMDVDARIPEHYFIKNDTIYISYQGDEPYTKFVIQKLEPGKLTLLDPNSNPIEFTR